MLLDLIDGAHVIYGEFFIIGIIFGIPVRWMSTALLYSEWIHIKTLTNVERQTTVGYIRQLQNGIDLKRMNTYGGGQDAKATVMMNQPSNSVIDNTGRTHVS